MSFLPIDAGRRLGETDAVGGALMPALHTERCPVTDIPAASSERARSHFESLLARGRVPGAVNLPHGRITGRNLAEYPRDTLFVVYCSGPHCKGMDRAAIRLARHGRPVKMIGGITGWLDEGLELAASEHDG